MDKLAERLVIFAPEDAYPWSDMIEDIDYAAFVPISAARGGIDLGKETIIATIGGSMKMNESEMCMIDGCEIKYNNHYILGSSLSQQTQCPLGP